MRIHLLDMGQTKYGDCLLLTQGNRNILIDGAHPGDSESITNQLENLLGGEAPFSIDLLIVTHCHSDHIGCLPKLVKNEVLKVTTALVADEKLGWGRDSEGDSPIDHKQLSSGQRKVLSALLEEDHSDLPDDELEAFLQDAETLENQYISMLATLAERGTEIVRYRGPSTKVAEIENEFTDFGLRILGPSKNHLVTCAQAIASFSDSMAEDILADKLTAGDASGALLKTYRRISQRISSDSAVGADRPGVGAAKNNQSIVVKIEAGGWAALLAGDMQFAQPEVSGLDTMMSVLRQKIRQAGPYQFVKLTHHTSYNAVSEEVLGDWPDTKLFAHTGGRRDGSHPDDGVLALLEDRADEIKFARTDRNGLITVKKNGGLRLEISRGRLNNFSPNQVNDEESEISPKPEVSGEHRTTETTVGSSGPVRCEAEFVEVITRVPHTDTTVTVTIQVEPGQKKKPERTDRVVVDRSEGFRLGGGRSFPSLLAVTCRSKLEKNIGPSDAKRVCSALEQTPGITFLSLPDNIRSASEAAREVRPFLNQNTYRGVLIVGGYDIVPANQLDLLDSTLRAKVDASGYGGEDADNFIVWSDEIYGDSDGDDIAEFPVSRVPDGGLASVLFSALQAAPSSRTDRFGVRNVNRPFAIDVFPLVPGTTKTLHVSEKVRPKDIPVDAANGSVYFMLHGSAHDATRFWGETSGGSPYEAVDLDNVPRSASGSVVFTGCCWGALIAAPPAAKVRNGTQLRSRDPSSSLAMAYLQAGALAFVGCTGSHYSPLKPPFNFYGKPLHDAFWSAVAAGHPPAEALFQAKQQYAKQMPHGKSDPFSLAVELKILRQFTCLGLGW